MFYWTILFIFIFRFLIRAITGLADIEMEWKRYEEKIVEKHNVKLVGWPASKFDPHELGVTELNHCLTAC